ncbi:hypothetical protein [Cupriavidus pauculus]|jgi:hypothetical protein
MSLHRFHQELISAINNRRVIQLTYDGWSRTVEPHAYGLDRHGHALLRCYQTAGGSQSRELGWKLLRTDEILSMLATSDSVQSARPGYKRGDTAMQTIYAQL